MGNKAAHFAQADLANGRVLAGGAYTHHGDDTFFAENVTTEFGNGRYITRIVHWKFPLRYRTGNHSIISLHFNDGGRVVTEKHQSGIIFYSDPQKNPRFGYGFDGAYF